MARSGVNYLGVRLDRRGSERGSSLNCPALGLFTDRAKVICSFRR